MEIPARFFFWYCWTISYIFMDTGLGVAERTFSDSVSSRVMYNFDTLIRVSSAILLFYTILLHPHCGVIAEYLQYNELPSERNIFNFIRSKVKRWVEFAVGMVGSIPFQNFFRITSFNQVVGSKVKRWVEFAVGMVGSILFQNFFRITSFNQVVAFLCLAVAWLATIVLVSASDDLGVFNFLLGNVIVGCTVSEYGLRGATWIACGAAVVLYGLRVKLESLALVDREGNGVRVVLWQDRNTKNQRSLV